MRHSWPRWIVPIAMVVTATWSGVSVAQNNDTDKAVAHIDLQEFGGNVKWDVSARSNFNGTQPRGSFRFENSNFDPNFVLNGEVTCLQVVGNVAFVGGIVTDVRGGTTTANGVQMAMTDSGKFSAQPDLFGALFLFLPPGAPVPCPTDLFQDVVIDGEVIVHDAR